MRHPNVVFIFDDQHRHSALGCYGNPVVKTPNLDRLARGGVLFENAFSNCPICSPFRGMVMSGRYAHQNGVVDNEYGLFRGQTTFPAALKTAGYTTAFVGKWHLGYPPYTQENRFGFDTMCAYNCIHQYYKVQLVENDSDAEPVQGWGPTAETDRAIRFIEEHVSARPDTPFMLMMSWGPPHWSGPVYDQYPDEFKIYDPAKADLPANVPEQMTEFAKKEIAHYYGMITALDAEFGRITDTIKRLGISDDTIVVFSSDHGDHLSSHGYGKPMDRWLHTSKRASKATPYDESIHVPFIASWPGHIPQDVRSTVNLSAVDMMPTLLGLCDVEVPREVTGTDLSGVLLGKEEVGPDSVYLQILGPGWPYRGEWVGVWRGVRMGEYTYARWLDPKIDPMLFDRRDDPGEMINRYYDPKYIEVRKRLENRLTQWIGETGDPFETGERDEQGMLKLGQYATDPESFERLRSYNPRFT